MLDDVGDSMSMVVSNIEKHPFIMQQNATNKSFSGDYLGQQMEEQMC